MAVRLKMLHNASAANLCTSYGILPLMTGWEVCRLKHMLFKPQHILNYFKLADVFETPNHLKAYTL